MDGSIKHGIREYLYTNIESATDHFTAEARRTIAEWRDIEIAMLSEKSTAVKQYLNDAAKHRANTGPKLSWSERMKDQ